MPPRLRIRREVTKSDAGAREVVLNKIGVWAASGLLDRAKLLGASHPNHYLLPADCSKHTKAIDPVHGLCGYDVTRSQVSWASAWEKLRDAAGFPDIRFHDLRHTFITQAVEGGVPIEVIMAQVGHISVEMTRYYTHLGTRARERVATASEMANVGLLESFEVHSLPFQLAPAPEPTVFADVQ
jgi:integrase